MKSRTAILIACLAIAAGLCVARAGQVADRARVVLAAGTGVNSWSNSTAYASLEVVRVTAFDIVTGVDTIAVSRVFWDGAATRTDSVDSVTMSASNGTAAVVGEARYLQRGDRLRFAGGSTNTAGTIILEYIQSEH